MPPRRHHHDQHLADEHHPRRPDSSPSSDYDEPRRRHHRNVSSPPYRPASSHSPSPSYRSSRYEETPTERLPRSKGMKLEVHRRSPSPPGRRSTDDRGRTHGHHERYYSPSPAKSTSHRRGHSVRRGRDRQPSPGRRHRSHPPPASNRHPHTGLSPRWQGAAAAAFQAGSLAALAMRSEPGAWNGSKGARVATAALGAGMIKAVQHQSTGEPPRRSGGGGGRSRSNDRDSKGRGSKMKTKGINMVGGKLSGLFAKEFAREKHSMR